MSLKYAKYAIGVVAVIAVITLYAHNTPKDTTTPESQSVRIGISAAISGPASFIGDDFVYGLELAKKEINEYGGINNKKIELIIEDNKNNAKEGISAYRKLALGETDLIVSSMSVSTVPIIPLVTEDNRPLFSAFVYADIVSDNDLVSRYFFLARDDVTATLKDMEANTIKSVGVLYLKTEYGQANFNAFKKEAGKYGVTTIYPEEFLGEGNDYLTPLQKIIEQKPDAIYVIGIRTTPIISQLKSINTESVIYTNVLPVSSGYVYSNPDIYNNVHLTSPSIAIPGTDEYASFTEKLSSQSTQPKSIPHTAIGYDVLHIIKSVLEKNPDPQQFTETFQRLGEFRGANGTVHINSRDVGIELFPVVFKNGKLEKVE